MLVIKLTKGVSKEDRWGVGNVDCLSFGSSAGVGGEGLRRGRYSCVNTRRTDSTASGL